MADYYPLIARAIAGLDPSAPGESRRALYERARAALIAQLRSVQPPLSESEITRERLSLEEAVRKVESEAAQRAREVTRPIDPSRSGGDRARAGAAVRAAPPPHGGGGEPVALSAPAAVAPAIAAATAQRAAAARPGRKTRPAPAAQPSRRRVATAALRAASPDAGPAAAADPRAIGRAAPRPRQQRSAGAGRARLPRHRRRRRRSRPRRGASQPLRAKDLCQRALALAGVRPAGAELGKPRRRSRRALFV